MKHALSFSLVLVLFFVLMTPLSNLVHAQAITLPLIATDSASTKSADASSSASASEAATQAEIASVAAQLELTQRKDRDITESGGKQKGELVALLDNTPIQPLAWYNFLQHAIRNAVTKGVPANTIVLILLFPVITAIIAGSRHVIGLRGFGVYTPAVLSVAFVSTGIVSGVILFLVVLAAALLSKKVIQKLRLQYLPRTAMLMWSVSIAIFAFLLLAGEFGMTALYSMSIFTILIIMLLTENFMETQLASSQSEAIQLTLETLILAIFATFIIGSREIQSLVILHPELALLAVAVSNLIVGRYNGLRLLEYFRFRSLLEK